MAKLSPKLQWILICILLLTAVRSSLGIIRLWRAGDILGQTQDQLTVEQKNQHDLQTKLTEARSDAFVEREARDKLGYAKEDEVIVVVTGDNEPQDKKPFTGRNTLSTWQRWRQLYLGF